MSEPVHVRRCHMCGGINEADDGFVDTCEHCGKSLAPFYYFDDRFSVPPSDLVIRSPRLDGEYRPIQGLTAYWDLY